jgi:hypothetical protein
MISESLNKIVDEAVGELDNEGARYLIERVCADAISAFIDAAKTEGVAPDAIGLMRSIHKRWTDS